MKYLIKVTYRISLVSMAILLLLVASPGTTRTAFAASEDCSEAKLRDLGVLTLNCAGDNAQDCAPASVFGDSSCACKVDNANLLGGDNPEKAFRFFVEKGLSVDQSAAIVGNMSQESGVNPERVQGIGNKQSKDPKSSGALGWGIIQWSPGVKVFNIAKSAGVSDKPIYELGTQLEMVWWHLNNVTPTGAKNVLPGFKATTGVDDAVQYFEKKVEGAGDPKLANRIKFANGVKSHYAGSTPQAQGSTATPAQSCGSATQFSNGFVVYSQYDAKWKSKPYGDSTIGASGCGPSAMAMIITALTKASVTPDVTSSYAASIGMKVANGSKWEIAPRLAEKWGLKASPLAKDLAVISSNLQQGKLIITSGAGAVPFTQGGHFIVIRGITDSGKFLVGDSGHLNTSDQEWDTGPVMANMKPGSIYAISK